MKLIVNELTERFKEVGDQSASQDPLFIVKFFNPCGSETWYATEYDAKTNICFGYVTGMFVDEWGNFSVNELEDLKLPFGLRIERDIHFKETPSSCIIQKNRATELMKSKSKKGLENEIEH